MSILMNISIIFTLSSEYNNRELKCSIMLYNLKFERLFYFNFDKWQVTNFTLQSSVVLMLIAIKQQFSVLLLFFSTQACLTYLRNSNIFRWNERKNYRYSYFNYYYRVELSYWTYSQRLDLGNYVNFP